MRDRILEELNFNDKWWDAGLEANIGVQNDQPFVNSCLEQIYKMRGEYEKNKSMHKDSEVFFKYSGVAKASLSSLASILTKRFGISFTILPDTTGNACVFPITAQNYNAINPNSENIKELIVDSIQQLKDMNNQSEEKEYINDASSMKIDTISGLIKIYESVLSSTTTLEDTLNSTVVEFDLANARIKKLPESILAIMAIDFVTFFKTMSDSELLAIILHEVGHQYTHLLNMYRTSRTNTILKDTMKLALEEKVDKVNITLSKEFGLTFPKMDKLSTIENVKEVSVFIEALINKATFMNANTSKVSTRDSEALADQFAGKFGLEKDLISALTKVSSRYNEADMMLQEPLLHIALLANIILFILGILLVLLVITTGAFGLALFPLLIQIGYISANLRGITIVIAVAHTLFRFLLGDMDSWEMVYDDKKRRFERIRNDSIRNLRGMIADGVDKSLIKRKLDDIDEMEAMIASVRKGRSIVAIFGEFVFPWQRRHSTETLYQQKLENLEANKLTLLSEKFK